MAAKLQAMFKSSHRLFLLNAIVAACLAGCSSGQSVQTAIVTHQPVTAGPYVIAPDDQIEVIVWKQREVSGKVVVAQDGTITVPLAGRITAAGLTSDAGTMLLAKGARIPAAFVEKGL